MPFLGLIFNALVWGLSWWPLKTLESQGLHPLWATALMYALVLAGLLTLRPVSLRLAWQYPVLLLLAASCAAGFLGEIARPQRGQGTFDQRLRIVVTGEQGVRADPGHAAVPALDVWRREQILA